MQQSIQAKLPLVEAKLPSVEAKLPLVEAKLPSVEAKLPLVEAKLPLVEAKLPLVQLHVTQSFVLPDVYLYGSTEEVEEALYIGALTQQTVQTRRSNDEVRTLETRHQVELQRIQAQYQDRLVELQEDIRLISAEKDTLHAEYSNGIKEARLAEKEICGRDAEEKVRLLKKEYDVLQARYEVLEMRKREMEELRAQDIQEAVKRTEELMEKVVVAKQQQLDRMEATYHKLNDNITKQADEVNKLSSTLGKRNANVKTKGSDYEDEFGEKLRRAYGLCRGFQVKDTRLGMGHEMDFSMELDGQVVLWEVKNYTAVVPKAEVEKFLRDVRENPQAHIGVMISRYTDMYGKSHAGNLVTEFDGENMMIYVNRFEEFCGEDENRVFQMLHSLFQIWWEYHKEDTKTFDRVEMIRELEKAVEELGKRRTEWRRHKAHLEEITRWSMDLLDESEDRLDRLLKKARHTDSEVAVALPEGVFRETGEEKERIWSTSIMKVCSIGGEIEVRELVDRLTAHHKLSKDTIRTNVMSIIKDSAVLKKGVIKYIKGISPLFIPPK
jgi:hypothetical protein